MPVVVHAGHAVEGTTTRTDLAAIDAVAFRYPEARIVIAHCGHHAVAAAVAILDNHANVYADLTPVVDDLVPIDAVDAARLSPRLLLGTDAPNTGRTATDCLAHLDSFGLTVDQRAAIAGGNARRLVADVGRPVLDPDEATPA